MKRESGISLVELLIAMVIGLLVLLAVSQAYITGIGAQRSQTDVSRLNETGRFAFLHLSNAIQRAGFTNRWQPGATAQYFCQTGTIGGAIAGCNDQLAPFTTAPSAAGVNITNCSGGGPGFNGGITNGSDVLRVRYYGEDTNTTAGTVDCQGNAVARDQLVEETFYLNTDTTSGEPALYCRSSISGTGVVLVAGVESLQFLYGVDTDNNGTVDRYVPWHLVTTPTDLRDGVLSIHASLVVRSPNAVAGAQTDPITRYAHFGAYSAATPWSAPGAPETTRTLPAWPITAPSPAASSINNDIGALFAPFRAGVGTWDRRLRQLMSKEISFRNFRYCS